MTRHIDDAQEMLAIAICFLNHHLQPLCNGLYLKSTFSGTQLIVK